MSARPYRYQLPTKAIKSDCPDCGPKHRKTLSRYTDTQNGELLPGIYGRCDRESSCGYHLSPYTKGQSGLCYADEVYQRWKEENQQSPNHARPSSTPLTYSKSMIPSPANLVAEELPICSIPEDVFIKSLSRYEQNQFARLLRKRFGTTIADELLQCFQIGTSKCWNDAGACVFWLIDEQGRKRGAQVKLFDDTFHTVKYVDREGKNRTRTSWGHSVMAYAYDQQQQDRPEWLTNYIEQADFAPCLFGLPQLLTQDSNKPIAIVEAPKTAVLATPYFPQFIWLAVMARSYLNAKRLAPLKEKKIILFPDLAKAGRDYEYWQTKAKELCQQGFQITVSDYLERIATDDDREKGVDIADYLLQVPANNCPYLTLESGQKIIGEPLTVEPSDYYPTEWDEPSRPDDKPTIKPMTFFEWQRQHPAFSQLGLASLRTANESDF